MADPRAIVSLITQRSRAYALAQGASEQEASAFARVMVAIAQGESSLNPAATRDTTTKSDALVRSGQAQPELSVGLYQLNFRGGRGTASGLTPEQAKDPDANIRASLPELWGQFRKQGGGAAFAADPIGVTRATYKYGQGSIWPDVEAQIKPGLSLTAGGLPPPAPDVGSRAPAARNPTGEPARPIAPVRGAITSKFGSDFYLDGPATYQGKTYEHFNKGVDYGVNGGAAVAAMAGGTVVVSGDDKSGWGPRVVVRDQDGFLHSYGHLDAAGLPPVGSTVQAGQTVGRVAGGAVGTSTGSHLSYDVFEEDGRTPVDPSPWLGQDVVEHTKIAHDPAKAKRPSYLGPGAEAMTTPANPRRIDLIEEALREEYDQAKSAVSALEKQAADLEKAGTEASKLQALTLRSTQLKAAYAVLDDARTAWVKVAIDAGTPVKAGGETEAERLVAATQFGQAATAMGHTLFSDNVAAATFWTDMLNSNFNREYQQWQSAHEQRKASFDEFVSVVSAQALQQTAEAARAGKALEAAGFIQKGRMELAERLLPPGTHYQYGFGPDDPLMVEMRKKGYNPEPIRVTPVDAASLDPANILREAEGILTETGYGRPNLDVAALRAQAEANKGLPSYQAGVLDPTKDTRLQLPDVPNYDAIFADFVAGALDRITPAPDVGSGQIPSPAKNPAQVSIVGIGSLATPVANQQAALAKPLPKPVEEVIPAKPGTPGPPWLAQLIDRAAYAKEHPVQEEWVTETLPDGTRRTRKRVKADAAANPAGGQP